MGVKSSAEKNHTLILWLGTISSFYMLFTLTQDSLIGVIPAQEITRLHFHCVIAAVETFSVMYVLNLVSLMSTMFTFKFCKPCMIQLKKSINTQLALVTYLTQEF